MSDWTPTARTTVASGADAIRYSNSAVFPIPASPRSTSDRLSPPRIPETRSSSSPHSLARPRRRPTGSRRRPSDVIGDLGCAHEQLPLVGTYCSGHADPTPLRDRACVILDVDVELVRP